jgi:6-phosphogluconate dehydrogenase
MPKKKMQMGFIGLGKMGMPMVRKLLSENFDVVVYNKNSQPVQELAKEGAVPSTSVAQLAKSLKGTRIIWLMVPAGPITDSVMKSVARNLKKGDIVIDGGNSFYEDTALRAEKLKKKGINLLDCGTSGGVEGTKVGMSLMVGGESTAFKKAEKIFKAFASPEGAYGYFGPSGAGHFVKMVHNGVEYGMMQAIGEGVAILKAKEDFKLKLPEAARVWSKGSVIRGWLMELTEAALRDKGFAKVEDYVDDLGEGRWTAQYAMQAKVPAPIITQSIIERDTSKVDENFAHKIVAALREQFGGKRTRGKN